MPVEIFAANDGVHGVELWKTDGTAAGTVELADIDPGSLDSNPSDLAVVGGLVYFTAFDGSGNRLWRTDGSASGTIALGDHSNAGNPAMMTAVGGNLFYDWSDSAHGQGLFVTDGTAAGTQFLAATSAATDFTTMGGKLYFVNSDATHGTELWSSDGTVAGTGIVADINPGSSGSYAAALTLFDGKLYFSANDGVHGDVLWSSDGTAAGTAMVSDLKSGTGGQVPSDFVVAGSELFFLAGDNRGSELWATDGTAAGTVQLTTDGGYFGVYGYHAVGDKLYFEHPLSGSYYSGLYVSDGTVSGTTLLADVDNVSSITGIGSHIVFAGQATSTSGVGGNGLYVSDGTTGGTKLVAEGTIYGSEVSLGGKLYFQFTPAGGDDQLWTSDGTLSGTHLVEDLGGAVGNLSTLNNRLLFTLDSASTGDELWTSDGTATGAHMVRDINPLGPGYFQIDFGGSGGASIGGKLIFEASSNAVEDLYVSDGTAAGTAILSNLPAGQHLQYASNFIALGARLVFTAYDFNDSNQLWSTGGVAGDAVMLTGAMNGFNNYNGPTNVIAYNGEVYFTDTATGSGSGLFVTDGTVAGTHFVAPLQMYQPPVVLDGKMLFLGITITAGNGLYLSDGTSAGIDPVSGLLGELDKGAVGSNLTVSGDKAFFTLNTNVAGTNTDQLWVTDGTSGGTLVATSFQFSTPYQPASDLTAFDGGVVFAAADNAHGSQVWFSDGTVAGSYVLQVNQTKDASAALAWETNIGGVRSGAVMLNGKAYFTADDGIHGAELWSSDGTTAGTAMVADLTPGLAGTAPSDLTVLNGKLLFTGASGGLWISDGTAAGTTELSSTIGQISEPVVLDGRAYFDGIANSITPGLFATDGTLAGTVTLASGQLIGAPVAAGDTLFWNRAVGPDWGLYGYNALTHTTTLLADVSMGGVYTNAGGDIAALGSKLIFAGHDSAHGMQLWSSDGTVAGTVMLTDVGFSFPQYNPTEFTVCNGELYFVVNRDGVPGAPALWVTDGTVAGTKLVTSPSNPAVFDISELTVVGSKLYFVEHPYTGNSELMVYDTSSQLTSVFQTLPDSINLVSITNVAVANGVLFYTAADPTTGLFELFRVGADGAPLVLIETTASTAPPLQLTTVGNKIFFYASDNVHGPGLFVSDGSVAGTIFLTTMPGVPDSLSFSAIGGQFYFQNYDATNGTELWVSDGTVAGTHRLTDTESPNSANAGDFTVVGSQVFFSATDGVHGQELWSFNGAPGGAHMVADLNPGSGGSNPTNLTALGGALYFEAANASGKVELYRSDGTTNGTVALTTPTNGENVQNLGAFNGKLFFFGSDSTHGSGLFVSDGTAGGTTFLLSLPAGESSNSFSAASGELYFNDYDPTYGAQLWKTDGTVAGTVRVTDTQINQGSYPSDLTPLTPAQGDFSADGRSDILWRSTSGDLSAWQVGGGGGALSLASQDYGVVSTAWTLQPVGDFNGDGAADVLWRNTSGDATLWLSGAGSSFAGYDLGVVSTAWTIQQVGDFNGDGKSDILWRGANGDVDLWLSNGGTGFGGFASQDLGVVPGSWIIRQTGDFNGDGKADILWQAASGQMSLWLSNDGGGYTGFAGQDLGMAPGGWTIQQVGDFNGDGKADILWRDARGDLALWASNSGSGYSGFTGSIAGVAPSGDVIQQVGDFNGDGKADLVWLTTDGQSDVWLSDGGSGFTGWTGYGLGLAPTGTILHQPSDFNGDGGADIVWRNSSGEVSLWLSNGGSGNVSFSGQDLGGTPNSWTLQQVGDFNGDGKADMLWRGASGDTALWLSNAGAGYDGFTNKDLGTATAGWTVQAVGDFNGDGKADMVWRSGGGDVQIWASNAGAGYTGFTGQEVGMVSTDWTLLRAGDFNGDGKADLLWRNGGGDVAIWQANSGMGFTGFTGQDAGVVPTDWTAQPIGDFNGDGKADILWRTSSGDMHLWLSQTGSISSGYTDQDLGAVQTDWTVQQVGDFNGDGKADVLWRTGGGHAELWLSNSGVGFNGFTTHDFGLVSNDWHVV